MELLTLIGVAGLMLVIGVPIGVSIGSGILALIYLFHTVDITYVAQAMYSGFDSIPIVAIPVFMLAGTLMETGGLSRRLVNVAQKCVGNVTGGLSTVTVLACMFFGAISGSAPATVAAIGAIMLPHMVKSGYERTYSTGLIANAGSLGVIVPPSIPLIVYGSMTGVSVSKLFLAGIGPAVVVGIILIAISTFIARKKGYKGGGDRFSWRALGKAAWDAKWAILMPIIILGGIYGGVFTPTEAAVIALAYSIIIGVFVYKELTFKDVIKIFYQNAPFVGGMMLTFAPAAALGSIFSLLKLPALIGSFLTGISSNLAVITFIMIVFLVILGMIMDAIPAIIIFGPILYQVLIPLGMDGIQLGLIMVLCCCIGFVTPPVAQNMFVASSLTGIPVNKIAKKSIPFMVGMFIAALIVAYVPAVTTGILTLFGY